MLLVLLDEMNLARVEYYFSEFLSRLEGRPVADEDDEALLRPSRIDIDVPLGEGKSLSIYPGHNTLFVGTMNEDESTQSLSDILKALRLIIKRSEGNTARTAVGRLAKDVLTVFEERGVPDTILQWDSDEEDVDN